MTQKAENITKGEFNSVLYRRTTYAYDGDGNQTEICFYGGSWYLKQEENRRWLEEKVAAARAGGLSGEELLEMLRLILEE